MLANLDEALFMLFGYVLGYGLLCLIVFLLIRAAVLSALRRYWREMRYDRFKMSAPRQSNGAPSENFYVVNDEER